MRLCALLIGFWVLSSCGTSTFYTESKDEIRISAGYGGWLKPARDQYQAMWDSGKRIVVDGHVISADAFFAFAIGGCYTENVVFSPHAASYLGLVPNREATEKLTKILPDPLERWFRSHHSFYDWMGFSELRYDDLRRIWPEGECSFDRPTPQEAQGTVIAMLSQDGREQSKQESGRLVAKSRR